MEFGVSRAAPVVFSFQSPGYRYRVQTPESKETEAKHFGHVLFTATLYSVAVAR